VKDLTLALESTNWSLFSVLLSSSYSAWGLGRLGQDAEEIAKCVQYVRNYKSSQQTGLEYAPGKIVIMGHSTGSQDVLYYLCSPNPLPLDSEFDRGLEHITRPGVDGAILQAPVSDREFMLARLKSGTASDPIGAFFGLYTQLVNMAKRVTYTDNNTVDVLLPLSMTARLGYPSDSPISCRRFLSLVSPDSPENPAEEDLFSSDFTDERLQETFGAVGSRGLLRSKLLVLYSGNDQFAPEWVDKEKLLQRWQKATNKMGNEVWDAEYSGVIPGATHDLSGEDEDQPKRDLITRVVGYLGSIE
jgi:Protein of unknown function (DUF1749)